MNNALPNLMNYSTTSNICPKSVYPHQNLQYICINLKSGLRPEMNMEPTILGIEDLVWHKGMEQPELPEDPALAGGFFTPEPRGKPVGKGWEVSKYGS